jgi:hypothetical protein
MRVLLLATTTGYQLRAFDAAAEALGFQLVFATNRCDRLDDPWRDRAIPVRFYEEEKSVGAVARAVRDAPLNGVVAVGDRPAVLAALLAERLGLPGNPPAAARAAVSKLATREALSAAGLPVPWFFAVPADSRVESALDRTRFPCVVKPLALAGSRGVMRADDPATFIRAFERLRALLARRDVLSQRNDADRSILVEEYVPGDEFAVEAIVTTGDLTTLALFDKPDPLEGPFFEETIYVTPSRLPPETQGLLLHTIGAACRALGLRHGPVHAEARVNRTGVYVLEVAARPIGGLCARALRFTRGDSTSHVVKEESHAWATLEELLLVHSTGGPVAGYKREPTPSGVMMIPVPRYGQLKAVEGVDAARAIAGIEDVVVTAKPGQMLVPPPEGSSYPGFIFARAATPERVEAALREAHRTLRWIIERPIAIADA